MGLGLDRPGRLATEPVALPVALPVPLVDEPGARGVAFKALNSPMAAATPAARAFVQVQAAFAEVGCSVARSRVREGLAAGRARGRTGGRLRIMTAERLRHARRRMADPGRSIPSIRQKLDGIGPSTLQHHLHAGCAPRTSGQAPLGANAARSATRPAKACA